MTPYQDERYRYIFEGLNEKQREIVARTEGNISVIASAGAGKTRVLTNRVAYLIAQGIPAWQILCITFTNKAASEMRERIQSMVPSGAKDIWMGTFHSICLRIIRAHMQKLGFEQMTIIESYERTDMIKRIIELIRTGMDSDTAEAFIESAQNNMKMPSDFGQDDNQDLVNIYRAYQDEKKKMGYIDFNDILNFTVLLLRGNPEVRQRYQNQFRYVMCDESQDTNDCQFEILSLLSSGHNNLALIGDTDQAIYGFRGSRVENLIHYSNRDGIDTIQLDQNYRSTGTIIKASNALVELNSIRVPKTSFTENPLGEAIVLYPAKDVTREADFVAEMIKRMHQMEKQSYQDMAVLFRNNRQAKEIEMALRQSRIPYKVVKGMTFFDRKEIKDIIGYLRAVDNPIDSLAFERIINVPKRGIGAKAIERIADYAEDIMVPFAKALEHIEDIPKMTKKAVLAVKDFNAIIARLQAYSRTPDAKVSTCIDMIISETNFLSQFSNDKNAEDDKQRVENIVDLLDLAREWEENVDTSEEDTPLLTRFLSETSLVSPADEDVNEDDVVSLMSVHSSKGLEFPNVFIIGLEEEQFPSFFAKTDEEIEEERRLMYVAMTRAKKRLFMSYSQSKLDYRAGGTIQTKPSRFLDEIPKNFIYLYGKR